LEGLPAYFIDSVILTQYKQKGASPELLDLKSNDSGRKFSGSGMLRRVA
jgi:hypothetical protein